jgi:AcrR family transcriptional regulator
MTRRRPLSGPEAQAAILDAAVALLRARRTGDVTTDEIAKRAGCAKGLVHYHFKRKHQLLSAAARRLWTVRSAAWRETLGSGDPHASIAGGWKLLEQESSSGTAAACAAIGLGSDELVVQSVNDCRRAFAADLTEAIVALLARMDLSPSVPAAELGTLLAATIEGVTLQMGSGPQSEELEQAWAAFWVGLLALTKRRRS